MARWAGVAGLALLMSACGTTEPEPLPPNVQSECALAEGNGPKIAVAYGVGGRGDRALNDSAFKGIARAIKRYDATCIEDEAVEGESETVREDRLRRMAEGSDLVIAIGASYNQAVNEVAPEFTEVRFAIIDGQDTDEVANSNVAYLRFAEDQGSFLMGAAAALKSQTKTVGFVGGVNDDLTNRYEAGYRVGAASVAPDVKILVTYLKESADATKPKPPTPTEAATDLFDQGADVVYQVSAGTGSGVFNAADEADGWAVGSEYDQYQTANEDQREHILTSMVKRTDTVTFDFIRRVQAGSAPVGDRVYGVEEKGVSYATSGGHVTDIAAELDDYATRLAEGEIQIPEDPNNPVR
jgi:basic membrane protein A